MQKPKILSKLFFWLVLSFVSTYFAEVLSGSQPFVFFIEFGYLAIIPLYGLHTLVLGAFALHPQRKISLRTIYFISLLFGMYEAYITKVLWSPPWNPNAFKIGGVALFESSMLVVFWHAFMSFIIPLFVVENLLCTSNHMQKSLNEQANRIFMRPAAALILGMVGGFMLGTNLTDAVQALISSLSTSFVVTLLILLWKIIYRKTKFDLRELLPGKIALPLIALLLLIYYLYYGSILRPESLPNVASQFTIWLLYAVILALIYLSMRKDRQRYLLESEAKSFQESSAFHFTMKHWLLFVGTFIFAASSFNILPDLLRAVLAGAAWLGGLGLGLFTLGKSIIELIKTPKLPEQK